VLDTTQAGALYADGEKDFVVTVSDESGKTTDTRFMLIVDNTAPQACFVSPTNGSVVYNQTTVRGSSSDNTRLDKVELRIGKEGTGAGDGFFEITGSLYEWSKEFLPNDYANSAQADDLGGDVWDLPIYCRIYDVAGNVATNEPSDTMDPLYPAALVATYSSALVFDSAKVPDFLLVIDLDRNKPTLTIQTPQDDSNIAGAVAVSGTCFDESPGMDKVEIRIEALEDDGTFIGYLSPVGDAGGAYPGAAHNGRLRISVLPTDLGGKVGVEQTVTFRLDNSIPRLENPQFEINGIAILAYDYLHARGTIRLKTKVKDYQQVTSIRLSLDGGSSYGSNLIGSGYGGPERNQRLRPGLPYRHPDGHPDPGGAPGGYQSLIQPEINVSLAADRPVAQIQLPADGELNRRDFVLSGMVFDDDGVSAVYYRIDNGEFQRLPGGQNFSVPLTLAQVGDNEHTIEFKAEDLGGLESETVSSRFQVSTSVPVSSLQAPAIDSHVRELVEIKGTSQDPNGIAEVRISLDNGVSYVRANGTETWKYRLDTRLLADGTHAVLVEAEDATGGPGRFTTTINVDNQAPDLVLDSPTDGQVLTGKIPLSGRAVDAVGVSRLAVSVTPMTSSPGEGAGIPETDLPLNEIMAEQLDIDSLAPGGYNLRIEASDEAGNRGYVSRNFPKRTREAAERVELLFPADGERMTGPMEISGRVYSENPLSGTKVVVSMDRQPLDTAVLNTTGHFHLRPDPDQVAPGPHSLRVQLVLAGDLRLTSETHRFEYESSGPWVDITSFATGDFVSGRPFLEGEAGYAGEEAPVAGEMPAGKEPQRGAQGAPKVQLVEISMDNGRSLVKADEKQSWRYRLETQALPFGYLFGPSWDFFSMSLAVGANFAYFTMSEDRVEFTDAGLILGSIVAQLEFARFAIPKWRAFNDYSLYTGCQLWFISSDIEGGVVNKITFGLRAGLL